MNLDNLSLSELKQLQKIEQANDSFVNKPARKQNNVNNVSMPPERSKIRSFLEGALDTGTLGFAPKAIGAIGAPILQALRPDLFGNQSYKDVYEDLRNYSRGQMAESQQANPMSYGLGGILGGAALPFPTNTVKGAAGLGAAYGALSDLGGNDNGEAFTLGHSDVVSALGGGVVGAALGGATQGLINKFFPTKTPNIDKLKRRVAVEEPPSKKPVIADEIKMAVEPEVEVEKPDIDILNYLRPAEYTANERVRISKKFNVPLTKGEALNRTTDLLTEEDAIRGRLGDASQDKIRQFNEERVKDYHATAENLVSKFSGNRKFIEKGENINAAVNKLINKALEERKDYSKVYEEAKKHVGSVNGENIDFFVKNITEDFADNSITKDNVEVVFNELNALKSHVKRKVVDGVTTDKFEDINLKKLEAWRQGLNRAYQTVLSEGDAQGKFAFDSLRNKFDGFIDGVIEHSINANDTGMLEQFKKARSLSAKWFGKYTADNPQEYGKKFAEDVINNNEYSDTKYANEHLVNKIFGGSLLGFKVESAAIVKELKKLLPGDAFNDIRIEAGQRLIQPLLKPTPNIITYKNNLNKFIRDNPTLAKELFTKEQLKDFIELGELGRFIFTREKSAMNPSGTADVILNKLGLGKYSKIIKDALRSPELNQEKIAKAAVKETKQMRQTNAGGANEIVQNTKLNPAVKGAFLTAIQPPKNPTQEKSATPIQPNKTMETEPSTSELDNLNLAELKNLLQATEANGSNDGTDILDKIQKVESNNNPNAKNPNSSASGLFQITDGTWKYLSKKYGLTGDKNDPQNQRAAANYLLNENKGTLTKALDRDPTDGELYMAHFLGAGDAVKLIRAKDADTFAAKLFPKAAKANKSLFFRNGKPVTTYELYRKLNKLI